MRPYCIHIVGYAPCFYITVVEKHNTIRFHTHVLKNNRKAFRDGHGERQTCGATRYSSLMDSQEKGM
jgi:hypothetical protein